MSERGITFERRQRAIGPYNVDFSVGTIAVEVRGRALDPVFRKRFPERTKHLFEAGWSVLWFYFDTGKWLLTPEVADYAARLIQQFSREPPSVCEYRMIWGAGEYVARGRANDNNLTLIVPFRQGRNTTNGRYRNVPREAPVV
jgi:hypothetical protein